MSFLRAFQWYHSPADPIWPDGTFKGQILQKKYKVEKFTFLSVFMDIFSKLWCNPI